MSRKLSNGPRETSHGRKSDIYRVPLRNQPLHSKLMKSKQPRFELHKFAIHLCRFHIDWSHPKKIASQFQKKKSVQYRWIISVKFIWQDLDFAQHTFTCGKSDIDFTPLLQDVMCYSLKKRSPLGWAMGVGDTALASRRGCGDGQQGRGVDARTGRSFGWGRRRSIQGRAQDFGFGYSKFWTGEIQPKKVVKYPLSQISEN